MPRPAAPRPAPRPTYRPRLEGLERRIAPALLTWLGGDGNWNDGSRWDLGRAPTAADDVAITRAGVVTQDGPAATVHNLTLAAGTLQSAAGLTVTGSWQWTSGVLAGPGTVTVAAGATLGVNGTVTLDGVTLVNAGSATWAGGDLRGRNAPAFRNAAGATFTADFGPGQVRFVVSTDPTTFAFLNLGTVVVTGARDDGSAN
jgi:hypothetical protein